MAEITEILENEANRFEKVVKSREMVKAQEEDGYDGFTDTNLKLIPTPNFTDAKSVGTMLPINMANETVTNISRYAEQFDLVEFIREKLNYGSRLKVTEAFSSEQIDALVLAIKSFEKENAFILGDMAGIGKGRICAGIMRYAIQQGLTPIFITHKPYLFSDIYRDVTKIGNFGSKNNKPVFCTPFILNANDPKESSIKMKGGGGKTITVFETMKPSQVRRLCEGLKLPKTFETREREYNFNSVFLTYSQISHTRKNVKQNFLEALAPKSILIFDESHNAASANESSRIMKRATPLVQKCKGVLFSSATYAKRPEVFGLYVMRTALRSAISNLDSVTDALKVGGENVSEYIATGLVYEGQMIRRERSFGDCQKKTSFVNEGMGDVDRQKEIFNEAVSYFKELRDFGNTPLYEDAAKNAIYRRVQERGLQLVIEDTYKNAKNGSEQTKRAFINTYRNRWVLFFEKNSINRYRATFRENLFYALKAKWTADKVIECLNTPVDYRNVDGSTHRAPMKPLIAIRNTGESIFNELDLQVGDEINNDFAVYLNAVYNKLFSGNFKLRRVNEYIFESEADLVRDEILIREGEESNVNDFVIEDEYSISLGDFADSGQRISEIQSRLVQYRSELPLSPIDYIREAITNTSRSMVYFMNGDRTQPKYGDAGSSNYTFSEATGRKSRLIWNPVTEKWRYERVEKTPITDIFTAFNSGATDVMLLNVTASTGGSAQSSPDEGPDTRPRNMFITQFELDINVEVQKRGRVNRTGQLNSPTYTYIITGIPVEKRTYLMFRKKLRKLDANTSANQSASSETAEISDDKGQPIEDIFNQYGYEVFMNDFINEPEFATPPNDYLSVWNGLKSRFAAKGEEAERIEANVSEFNDFTKELELYPADFQEKFFNVMNEKYRQEVERLKSVGEYQLELKTRMYKAFLKQRVPVKINSGDTIFSYPLFLSDYYTLEDNKAWSKEQIDRKADELAVGPDGKPMELSKFHSFLVKDFDEQAQANIEYQVAAHQAKEPKREDFPNDEEYQIAFDEFRREERDIIFNGRKKRDEMREYLLFFRPKRNIVYRNHLGIFVGFKIADKGNFRYSLGNVQFVFCCLSGYSVVYLKLSSNPDELKAIKENSERLFGGLASRLAGGISPEESQDVKDLYDLFGGVDAAKQIQNWKPNYDARVIRRFYAGNILSGIVKANIERKYKAEETGLKSWHLVRFNNVDGSITTAVELRYGKPLSDKTMIVPETTTLAVSSGSTDFVNYLEQYPVSLMNEIYPLWNVEDESSTEGIIERGLCVIRYEDVITVQVLQQFKVTKDGDFEDLTERSERWNKLYHDVDFFSKHRDNYRGERKRQEIDYARKITRKQNKYGQWEERTKYNPYKAHIKSFNFDAKREKQKMVDFFNDLSAKYDLQFNFRSSQEAEWMVESRADVAKEQYATAGGKKAVKKEQIFEEGQYQYRFIKPVTVQFAETVPNLIEFNPSDGAYGGVTVSLPMKPSECASYGLKPFKIPLDVIIKITFAALKDEDKTWFANKLEEMAQTDTPVQIGLFVNSYLRERAVAPVYFFGDIRTADIGLIFKEYALKNDLTLLVIEQEVEEVRKPRKTKVEFEDAENFIIKMLQ